MRIAHLAFDQKFIPFSQDVFDEAYPGANTWLLLHEEREPFRFIQNLRDCKLFNLRALQSPGCLEAINRSDLLVVHAMVPPFADLVKRASKSVTVMWIGWGYEYYSFLEQAFGNLILSETSAAWERALAAENRASRGPIYYAKALLRPAYRALKSVMSGHRTPETIKTVAHRIDLCSVSPSEMPFLKEALPGFRATHYQLHYYSKEDTLDRGPAEMGGPDILLGNSATPENNHFEVMSLLHRSGIRGRRIIVPLSYGHSHYADEVCRFGADHFGHDFVPLRDYVSIDEYHQRLARCGTIIMNHRRQAGMGNISAALYKGARVILRQENPIYHTYSRLGAFIEPMHLIEQNIVTLASDLSLEDRSRNRNIVGNYLDRGNLVSAIRGMEAHCKSVKHSNTTSCNAALARI